MWPMILVSLVFISTSVWAGPGRDAWNKSDTKGKAALLTAYQEWYKAAAKEEKTAEWETKKTSYFKIFAEAWATEGMDCIYAGWPSKRNGSCSSPSRANPDYQQGSCSSSQMQCQPMLFGSGLCANVGTSQQRQMAFSQCEQRFSAAGRTAASVVAEAVRDNKQGLLLELLDFADGICASGAQSGTGMCNRLKAKVASVRAVAPAAVAADPEVDQAPAPAPANLDSAIAFANGVMRDLALLSGQTMECARQVTNDDPLVITRPDEPQARDVAAVDEPILVVAPGLEVNSEEANPTEEPVVEPVDEPAPEIEAAIPPPPAVESGLQTPAQFVEAAMAEPLSYVGRGDLTRPTTVASCAFKNSQVYVVYAPCESDTGMVGMKIMAINGGTVELAVQNTGGTPVSSVARTGYNNVWHVGYQRTPALSGNADFAAIKAASEAVSLRDYCSVGPLASTPAPKCSGGLAGMEASWLPAAEQFWSNPGSSWTNLIRQTNTNIPQAR